MAPSLSRISMLASLSDAERDALRTAWAWPRYYPAKRESNEVWPKASFHILLSGWAGYVEIMPDGRRQITNLILPGEFIEPTASQPSAGRRALFAFTDLSIGSITAPVDGTTLDGIRAARTASLRREESYLMRHIVRLGRMNAHERVADWLLEISERLARSGLEIHDQFAMPLTQEELADYFGLTSVHVNRTLQQMRREGLLELTGKMLSLLDRMALARETGGMTGRVGRGSV